MTDVIRMGIMGTGMIVDWIMNDIRKASNIRVTAIASRSLDRAREAAVRYGIETAYGSYEELAQSDCVDLVYVATPNSEHCANALAAMAQGKHVLCEKPMALNESECARMIECARRNHVFLMEGVWTRFFPAVRRISTLLEQGAIGEIRHVESAFLCRAPYDESKSGHRLFSLKLGGGSLLDLGIYTLAATVMALGTRPERIQSLCVPAPTGADMRACVQMLYPSGATAHFTCGFDLMGQAREVISGSDGYIEVNGFLSPTSFVLANASGERAEYSFPQEARGHWHEFEHAARCMLEGRTESPLMPLEESLDMARIMTALRREWGVFYPGEKGGIDR